MSISTLTINSVDYTSYASLAQANARLAVDASRATTWATKTDDEKRALLVQATNALDLLSWGGAKAGGDSQANAFPRSSLYYASGGAVSSSEVPLGVENGAILLAGSIALNPEAGDKSSSGSNVKGVKAGSSEVTFFRQTTGVPLADETAYALVKEFLASTGIAGASVGPMASGSDSSATGYATSVFENRDRWGRETGFP